MESGELQKDRAGGELTVSYRLSAMKLDLYRRYKGEYVTPRNPVLLRVGPARYLSVSGRGDPKGPGFGAAVAALYGVAFTIKMAKKAAKKDYVVAKLEGLWWG